MNYRPIRVIDWRHYETMDTYHAFKLAAAIFKLDRYWRGLPTCSHRYRNAAGVETWRGQAWGEDR